MDGTPSVLMVDDGELGRVRHVLQRFEVELDHLTDGPIQECVEGPYDLLVTSVKRAPEVAEALETGALGKPTWIVFHGQDFLPLRERMRRLGVHFLIHGSVDSDALRLILLYALYRGPEKRDATRLPVGSHVIYRDTRHAGPVELLDLTTEGCRLLAPHDAEPGSEIAITLPPALARGTPIQLSGRVVRVQAPQGSDNGHRISVALDGLDVEARRRLEAIFAGKVIGTVVTRLAEDEAGATLRSPVPSTHRLPDPEPLEDDAIELEDIERRRQPRAPYGESITALTGEAAHVILGRDLSPDGMCVDRIPGASIGSTIRLALYGDRREEPIVVRAVVTRSDDRRGTALRFEALDAELRSRVEHLVATAATGIESLSDAHTQPRSVIVSKAMTLGSDAPEA
ncbi:MAG: PilZ domain-containing protein [Deltaproteobacteria bacterium]|nr:MAG: PilZ domain-containing protein [Deltaproteobacteria bacterium]